ncbi:MAG: hypothetical protein JNM18_27440 [Planctomycetaceae bacterium]|nr:hypothetical protein [Planctomycetaceae bacterium]
MKTFFTLAVAFVLGHVAAFGVMGCNSEPPKPALPKVEEKQPVDAKAAAPAPVKAEEKK